MTPTPPKQGGTYVYCEFKRKTKHGFEFCTWRNRRRNALKRYRRHYLRNHNA